MLNTETGEHFSSVFLYKLRTVDSSAAGSAWSYHQTKIWFAVRKEKDVSELLKYKGRNLFKVNRLS